ncbi:unnamed protein product, partial [Oikopleura dioica]
SETATESFAMESESSSEQSA